VALVLGYSRFKLWRVHHAIVDYVRELECLALGCRLRLKCDGTRAETRIRLSAKRTCPLKSAGASVQSTTGSRVVRISGSNGSNAGYTMFRGSMKCTGYPLHSPISPSIPLLCVTVCHHISTGLYHKRTLIIPVCVKIGEPSQMFNWMHACTHKHARARTHTHTHTGF
jgi:hypothetical protein